MFQQTITNFNINYDVYNESRTFSSGDRVTGQIFFELKKETKFSAISMEFRGKAHVHWSTSAGKNRRRHYSAKVDYFRIKSSILQDSGMPPPRRFAPELLFKLLKGKCLTCFLLQQQLEDSDFRLARMYIRSRFRSRKGVYQNAPFIICIVFHTSLRAWLFKVFGLLIMVFCFINPLAPPPPFNMWLLFCSNFQSCLKDHRA